jgi:hypothetical protein
MKTVRKQLALLCALVLIATASLFHLPVKAQTFNEGFETGTKTSYADAAVQLSTGLWDFNDALIGNLSTDRRTGTASARIRNTGSITMLFDVSSAGTVTIPIASILTTLRSHLSYRSPQASIW